MSYVSDSISVGRIFCDKCSRNNIALPTGYGSSFSTRLSSVTGYMRWISNYMDTTLERVCDACFSDISDFQKYELYIQAFDSMALPLPLLQRATAVSQNWRSGAKFCMSVLRQVRRL
jgi:hypothetical protein